MMTHCIFKYYLVFVFCFFSDCCCGCCCDYCFLKGVLISRVHAENTLNFSEMTSKELSNQARFLYFTNVTNFEITTNNVCKNWNNQSTLCHSGIPMLTPYNFLLALVFIEKSPIWISVSSFVLMIKWHL